jgi:hypothetical protein
MEYPGLNTVTPELKVLFEQSVADRGTQEANWQDYAGWTLPALYPQEDSTDSNNQQFQHDYQSLGAQAVNHLANRMTMVLFPPSRPFFKLEVTQEQSLGLQEQGLSPADVEALTSAVEQQAMKEMDKVKLRSAVIQTLKNLIVLGNSLMFMPGKGESAQVYSLRDYSVQRDASGTVLQLITRDRRQVSTLPEAMREQALMKGHKIEDRMDIYTGATRTVEGKYFVKQELESLCVSDGQQGMYMPDDLPWTALTWNLIRGHSYGTGLVEEYAGDFHVYSSLSEANLNIASIAADIKILVNPMGQTDVDSLNNSASGTYVYGTADDVSFLQMEKMNDFQFVSTMLDAYGRRIGHAFMMNSQVTRDAERVTAEEIRMQAHELEGSLGGVYSKLSETMQQPLARKLIIEVEGALADLNPVILTGVESLSRTSEHEQMMMFFNDLTVLQNVPDMMQAQLKHRDVAKMLAANRGIEYDKFLKTDKEMAEEEAQAREAQTQQIAADSAAESAGAAAGQPPGMTGMPM